MIIGGIVMVGMMIGCKPIVTGGDCDNCIAKIVRVNHRNVYVINIDSCEYLYIGAGNLTHKGNCKFCMERNRNTNK